MKMLLNRVEFLRNFLVPLTTVADRAVITVRSKYIDCTATKQNPQMVLYLRCNIKSDLEEGNDFKLNVLNTKKLVTALNCIDDDFIGFQIDENSITFSNADNTKAFKYHLLEDGIIETQKVKMDVIYGIGFDFEMNLTSNHLRDIMKTRGFVEQSEKIYFYTQGNSVFCLFDDKTIQNMDSATLKISDEHTGAPIETPMPMHIDVFNRLNGIKKDNIKMKVNTKRGIVMFEISDDNFLMQYIITTLNN